MHTQLCFHAYIVLFFSFFLHFHSAMYMQGLLEIVVSTIIALIGLVIFAYYEKIGCDPYRSGAISSPNQIVPYFVVDVLNYPGFPGLFLAILYAGALRFVIVIKYTLVLYLTIKQLNLKKNSPT